MTATASRSSRPARISTFVAALIALAALAGCSSGSADSAGGDYGFDGDTGYAYDSGVDGAAPEAEAFDDAKTLAAADRSVIVTGSLYMTVADPIGTADTVTQMVQSAGGRVDARSETAPDEYYGGSASLTLRIPADRLDSVVQSLRGLGDVDQFTTESYDVTTQVTDLEAQISTLRASTVRIQGLLADAKDITDIITLENELDRRQSELESLEAQQRGLDDQVSMSTIQLSLTTEPVVVVDDSPQNFWDGLKDGWDSLVNFGAAALVVLGTALPWLVLVAILLVAWVAVRRSRKSRHAAAAPTKATPAKKPAAASATKK